MKRLKLFISIFCLAVSLPLAYVIWQTYTGLAQEERAQLHFFCQTLFDEMEAELAALVQREENRAVDEYHHTLADDDLSAPLSPLARQLPDDFILGYFQNNPDGSFQTPMVDDVDHATAQQRNLMAQLTSINALFNQKKFAIPQKRRVSEPESASEATPQLEEKSKAGFADRYLSRSPQKSAKSYLGKKNQRTEAITARQALNLSQEDQSLLGRSTPKPAPNASVPAESADKEKRELARDATAESDSAPPTVAFAQATPRGFLVEVAPLQSVFINEAHFFIFRRIAINNQIFRQGFVLKLQPFLRHLAATHFESQPMAQFSRLSMQVMANGRQVEAVQTGVSVDSAQFTTGRTFPVPFDFMRASVQSDAFPTSPARRTLNGALTVLSLFMLLGLLGIYQSARAVVILSERRSQFVSSVTHELKTPLTNIRMYIEMLEQGIAATPDREQDYFHILGSESARLSGLINNVLELAKLEKKQRHFNLQKDNLEPVLDEVRAIMAHKLDQEEFSLEINAGSLPPFAFDREVVIQVLINLLENSIKFGRKALRRQITINAQAIGRWIQIDVMDSGPGIPKKALKKVFDDFYRVDNNLTRTTGGTGIGLALVKKFITALGGTVQAANNTDAGCTITLKLPLAPDTT
jgi:signal transduction histidine kinase